MTQHKSLLLGLLLLLFSNISLAQKATVTISEDAKVSKILSLKKEMEKENKLSDGYTIQLYYGEKNKANSTIRNYRNSYNTWAASIKYETPNYKVWVGNFSSRIDADRALIEIKDKFPSAFILKPERSK
ncbi:MAG: SPOR domain-containing protein [Flavobacteriaceae bacterium]|nr:SPOR domain-containing protein [Flavobacteriaceae bacterium]